AKRGDLSKAAQEFEAILKLQPNDASAAYQLAVIYRKTGATKRAEELFAKVGKARAEDPPPMTPSTLVQIIRDAAAQSSPPVPSPPPPAHTSVDPAPIWHLAQRAHQAPVSPGRPVPPSQARNAAADHSMKRS